MNRIIIALLIVLVTATALFGETKIRDWLLTPQEREQLLEEKRILEPLYKKRAKQLAEEHDRKLEQLRKQYNEALARERLKEGEWLDPRYEALRENYGRNSWAATKEWLRSLGNAGKRLKEIESKLNLDRTARQIRAYNKLSPAERMEIELDELRIKLWEQEREIDRLKEKRMLW